MLQTGVYIICPYLLTAFLGLWVIRKAHGKEAVYLCPGIATGVSAGNIIIQQAFPMFYASWQISSNVFDMDVGGAALATIIS